MDKEMMKNWITIELTEDDWKTILAILDVKKGKIIDREDALEINGIYWKIKQQIMKQM